MTKIISSVLVFHHSRFFAGGELASAVFSTTGTENQEYELGQ